MIKLNGYEVEFSTFPNNETKMNESSVHTKPTLNVIELKYETDADLIKLLMLKSYLSEQLLTEDVALVIYYMPYSRMDRSENNSSFSLKYIANFINNMNFKQVKVVEPHSDVTLALLNKSSQISVTNILLGIAKMEVGYTEDDYLFYPDAGAQKRYQIKTGDNYLVGHKFRNFQTGKIESFQVVGNVNNVEDKKIIIVDDLSSYGGTFVHSAIELRKLGFSEVHLLVTHAENNIFKGELFNNVDKVFTTDSVLTERDEKYNSQLRVYKLRDLYDLENL